MASSMTFDETRQRPEGQRKPVSRVRLVVAFVLMALLIALLGGGLWGFNYMREQGTAAYFASMVPPPTAVSAAPARSGPMPRYLEGIGSLTSVRQVEVAPEVAGRVTKILFEAGAEVKAGDPLVQLNDEEERADLGSYQAQATLAQANLGRTTKLANRDFASQATLDTNQSALDQARAGISRTQAVIDQKLIKAPFDGQLGIRQVQLGQYVSPGTTLVTLTDLDPLYVNFTLPEQTRAEVQVGRRVEVRVDAFPGRAFEAELTTVEPQVDPSTRTIRLQATLPNPDKLLLPGMFAHARLVLPPEPEVVTVPETAVTQTLYGDSVYIVRDEKTPDGKPVQKAVQTFVETGSVSDGRIVIRRGVQAGDLVVASGQLKLHNGAAVTVAPDSTALAVPATPPVQ
ncbi:MAG TPA: efflux RND transporter periplasmic adaptor subunit [Geminicoccaceae bacterium]|nr:efflux RND transporter periplasmic adaptor subunit [Geminicoccus sp.]HMU48423.1 efflux RND transporter periplasmic adaptor subunit [Geminicoccaceae bacterium]